MSEPRVPIGEDVARAYIDGRNEGRQGERARLREKVEAMRAVWLAAIPAYSDEGIRAVLAAKAEAVAEILALLDGE